MQSSNHCPTKHFICRIQSFKNIQENLKLNLAKLNCLKPLDQPHRSGFCIFYSQINLFRRFVIQGQMHTHLEKFKKVLLFSQ